MKRIVIGISMLLLAACGGGDGKSTPTTTSSVAKMNITDATSLVILSPKVPSKSVNAIGAEATKLFKITKDGYLLEVTMLDESGKPITIQNQPKAVYNAGTSFVIVDFAFESFLVNKTDGRAYKLNKFQPLVSSIYGNNIYEDNQHNIYYLSLFTTTTGNISESKLRIVKVNVANDQVTAQYVSPETDSVTNFHVDNNGTIIYLNRIITSAGGIINISPSYKNCWRAPDGNLYVKDEPLNGTRPVIYRVVFNNDGTISYTKFGQSLSMNYDFLNFVEVQSRLIAIKISNETYLKPIELYNEAQSPRIIEGLPPIAAKAITSSGTHYYIAGKNDINLPQLIKVNPIDDSYIDVLPVGQYEVYKMVASKDGTLLVNALRMSDGLQILGRITSSGTFNILSEVSTSNTMMLEQIN